MTERDVQSSLDRTASRLAVSTPRCELSRCCQHDTKSARSFPGRTQADATPTAKQGAGSFVVQLPLFEVLFLPEYTTSLASFTHTLKKPRAASVAGS